MKTYRAVVIGSSAGGLKALEIILSRLAEDFLIPIVIVQHVAANSSLASVLSQKTRHPIKEADDKELLQAGWIYVAPSGYHLIIESNAAFSFSVDEKVNNSRPSIDVLFESAADAFGPELIGVILTGSNADGSAGLKRIHDRGGLTIVQDPNTAEAKEMPSSALKRTNPDYTLPVEEISALLNSVFLKSGPYSPS